MKTRSTAPIPPSAVILCAGLLLPAAAWAQQAAVMKPAVQEQKAVPAPKPAAAPKPEKKGFKAAKPFEDTEAKDNRKPAGDPVQAVPVCGPKPFLCNDTP